MAVKNDWVRIHRTILSAQERTGKLPEDTQKVPFEMWVKGHLLDDSAEIGQTVTVLTAAGRQESGKLLEVNPSYTLNYGEYVPEIDRIGRAVKDALFGEGQV